MHSGDVLIGEILIDEADFPWLSGHFTPAAAFGTLRELFARELALTEDPGEEGDRARFRWSDKPFDA
nr:hypothetical protein [Streptomyces sp. S3(2020)]